jgi:ATP-dependent Lon protease
VAKGKKRGVLGAKPEKIEKARAGDELEEGRLLFQRIRLPALFVPDFSLLPGIATTINTARPKSQLALTRAANSGRRIFLVRQRNPEEDDPTLEGCFSLGVVAKLAQVRETAILSEASALVEGIAWGEMRAAGSVEGYWECLVQLLDEHSRLARIMHQA